jgi:Trypsin-like peptidase domain
MTITITHLEGPLAGNEQTFDDTVDAVVFGRDGEVAQIVYPPEYDVVGRRHFELRRTTSGDYTIELFGKRYVEMDGVPADNGTPVKSGSTFRLGRKDGPSFKVEVGAPSAVGLPVTADQGQMTTSTQRLGKYVAYGGSVLAAALIGLFVYSTYLHSTLADQIEAARAEAAARAANEFSAATLKTLETAVYLVAKKDGGAEEAEGTAWAFAPGMLATNAHVTAAIKGHEDEFFLKGPDGKEIEIASVVTHPGYDAFKSYKATQGTTRWGTFTPLDLINEYDVGIIKIDPEIKLPVMLKLAPEEELESLAPGTPVASIGFPVEGLAGGATATKAPATLHFGHISSLTDVFMCRADPDHRLLIQHSVPVTGGASGSPLILPNGEVIGIVNGGNTTVFKDKEESVTAKVRVPSAALINFAQRVDLLKYLADDKAAQEVEEDKTYWQKAAAQFDDYFDVAMQSFAKLAKSTYAAGDGGERLKKSGVLDAGQADSYKNVSQTYELQAEPGKIYGFIADAKGGVPVGINVKNKSTSKFLRDKRDQRQTSELELAPTAWVTVTEPTTLEIVVWSLIAQPAEYELHAFEWAAPKPTPSADAGS